MTTWFVLVVQKIYSKLHPVSFTNTHDDVTDLVSHGIVKNKKTWISWEPNITLLQNTKKSEPMPQMTHFEKLLFCRRGNL